MEKRCVVFTFNYPPRIGGESLVTYKLLNSSAYSFDVMSSTFSKTAVSDLATRSDIRVYNTTAGAGWVFFSLRQFHRGKKQYDCMMSRSMPVLSHVPALIVKFFHPRLKWIASISDPIYNTPYRTLQTLRSRLTAKIEDHIEKKVYRKADQLVFTNEYMMKYILQGKYEKYREKANVIGFGYDPSIRPKENAAIGELVQQAHGERHAKMIAHVGAMYGDRNADIMIEGYKQYLAEKRPDEIPVEVLFLGASKKNLTAAIEKAGLEAYMHVISTVPYEESLYCMRRVDALFLIDLEFEHIKPSIFLPSKVYDYVYAQKPIMIFGSNEGPVSDLLAGTGAQRFSYTVDGVKDCLAQFSETAVEPEYQDIQKFSVTASSDKLDRIITKLRTN